MCVTASVPAHLCGKEGRREFEHCAINLKEGQCERSEGRQGEELDCVGQRKEFDGVKTFSFSP